MHCKYLSHPVRHGGVHEKIMKDGKADKSRWKPSPYLFDIKYISFHQLLWMNAIETVNDLMLKHLVYFFVTINQHMWQCMHEIDFVKMYIGTHRRRGKGTRATLFVDKLRHWELTVRLNLHFFNQ